MLAQRGTTTLQHQSDSLIRQYDTMSSSNLVFKTWHGATSEETGTTTILPRSLQNLANNDEASLPARSPSHKRSLSFKIRNLGRQPQVLHRQYRRSFDGMGNLLDLTKTWSPGSRSSFSDLQDLQTFTIPLLDSSPTKLQEIKQDQTTPNNRKSLLFVIYLILFARYVIATFLSAFFPQITTQEGMSSTWEGIVFAAYPAGMAICSVVSPTLILRWGTRTSIMIGLLTCGLSTAIFGMVPDICTFIGKEGDVQMLQYMYTGAYFLNGLIGGLSDTGVLILVSAKFKDNIGVVFATIGTVCGIGCMLGPLVGAAFYSVTNDSEWKFRLPFLLTAAIPIVLCFICPFTLPQVYTSEENQEKQEQMIDGGDGNESGRPEEVEQEDRRTKRNSCGAALSVLSTPAVALSVIAIALSGTIVATLDPTLAFRLSTCKHNCTTTATTATTAIGFNQSESSSFSLSRNTSSYPDWINGHPAPFDLSETTVALFFTYSSITYVAISIPIGWIVDRYQSNAKVFKLIQASGFVLLALTFALLGPLRLPDALGGYQIEHSLNSMYCAAAALVLKGLGSATNNAAYPDMVIGIDEKDDVLSAIMSGAWNAAYSIGWAFGPLIGGWLYEVVEFDGFATIIAMVSFGYAVLLVVAVGCCTDKRGRV